MAETPNDTFETGDTERRGGGDAQRERGRRGRGDAAVWLNELDEILDDESQTDIAALKQRLREQLNVARGALGDAVDTATGAASGYMRRAIDCADVYVETRPWHAITCAAGVGFLLGMLCHRR
ncbi:MAG: DUF883 domain-containing protein [Alcaligenaceae bacterium]|nr:DUF883 domain-containing protein [Alcaligenaceae bacterium]